MPNLSHFAQLIQVPGRSKQRLIVQVDASFHEPRYGLTVYADGNETYREADRLSIPGISSTHAEFYALIETLEQLKSWGLTGRAITVQLDNESVVRIANQPKVKGWKWKQLHQTARGLMAAFSDLHVEWVPRKQNGAHKGAYQHRPRRLTRIVTPSGVTP